MADMGGGNVGERGSMPKSGKLPALSPATTERAPARQNVTDHESAEAMLKVLRVAGLHAIAIESAHRHPEPPLDLRSGRWHDIRAIEPITFALACWIGQGEDSSIVTYALDLSKQDVVDALGQVLHLPVSIVVHGARWPLYCLWKLGLDPVMPKLYDTHIAAAALTLGLYHCDDDNEIHTKKIMRAKKEQALSLLGQCSHYGLLLPCGELDDERLVERGVKKVGRPALVNSAVGNAKAILRLYVAQRADVFQSDLLTHLNTEEFPFIVPNIRMEWNGVRITAADRENLRYACMNAMRICSEKLAAFGLNDPSDDDALQALLFSRGLKDKLKPFIKKDGKLKTDGDTLETIESLCFEVIWPLRVYRKAKGMLQQDWMNYDMESRVDGRYHPRHIQLGAATGRNTSTTPSIGGIGRIFRPVVTAPPNRAIFELDYSQMEIAIMAAEHGDKDLLAAYHSGDVYAAAAQTFYASMLCAEDQSLPSTEFKKKHPQMRNDVKTLLLAILYNTQPPTIAASLNISEHEAAKKRDGFLNLFPAVKKGLEADAAKGVIRGYALIRTGLRRCVSQIMPPEWKIRNMMRNTPIQGGGAVVFKRAVALMEAKFRGTDTYLILPMHDAIVIECALENVDEVAAIARAAMVEAFRSVYPQVQPKIDPEELNPKTLTCWNKDGDVGSIDRFRADPLERLN
jgi:DNA polymerase I-like protein with 3'-5' exonuclease and polymerase domains